MLSHFRWVSYGWPPTSYRFRLALYEWLGMSPQKQRKMLIFFLIIRYHNNHPQQKTNVNTSSSLLSWLVYMMFQFWLHNWNLRNKDPSNWQTDRPTISPQQGSKQENLLYQVQLEVQISLFTQQDRPNNETEVVKHWKCLGRHIVGGKKGWIYEKKQRNKETNKQTNQTNLTNLKKNLTKQSRLLCMFTRYDMTQNCFTATNHHCVSC